MSNLSDIGFPVKDEQDVNEMIMNVLGKAREIPCPRGFYLRFSDPSGAEIYLQGNKDQELIGFNPHFSGSSRRRVLLQEAIERDSSELDGGFQALANPTGKDFTSSDHPFVFDVPDFRAVFPKSLPKSCEIQLSAFASNDLRFFESEDEFFATLPLESKLSTTSFIATGLAALKETEETDLTLARPIANFAGEIKEFELLTNGLTDESFYSFLVETDGGEIDVVADSKLISDEPKRGGILHGHFWLSGRLIETEE